MWHPPVRKRSRIDPHHMNHYAATTVPMSAVDTIVLSPVGATIPLARGTSRSSGSSSFSATLLPPSGRPGSGISRGPEPAAGPLRHHPPRTSWMEPQQEEHHAVDFRGDARGAGPSAGGYVVRRPQRSAPSTPLPNDDFAPPSAPAVPVVSSSGSTPLAPAEEWSREVGAADAAPQPMMPVGSTASLFETLLSSVARGGSDVGGTKQLRVPTVSASWPLAVPAVAPDGGSVSASHRRPSAAKEESLTVRERELDDREARLADWAKSLKALEAHLLEREGALRRQEQLSGEHTARRMLQVAAREESFVQASHRQQQANGHMEAAPESGGGRDGGRAAVALRASHGDDSGGNFSWGQRVAAARQQTVFK